MRFQAPIAIVLGLLMNAACGSAAAPAQHLRYADASRLAAAIDWQKPVVIEFQRGDRLPVELSFADQAFELAPAQPPLELVAKRRCFVRFDGARISKSFDGRDFDVRPESSGQFRIGLSMTRAGSSLKIDLKTPEHAEPPAGGP